MFDNNSLQYSNYYVLMKTNSKQADGWTKFITEGQQRATNVLIAYETNWQEAHKKASKRQKMAESDYKEKLINSQERRLAQKSNRPIKWTEKELANGEIEDNKWQVKR